MKAGLYWTVATLLLALVVHLFIVIFVPGVDTGQKLAELASAGEINSLRTVDAMTASGLITEANPDLAYAYCSFDVTERALEIRAPIPPTYWSIALYSQTADNFYTLNDRQVGLSNVKLLIVDEKTEVDLGLDEAGQPDTTIVVQSPTTTGIVLLRAFIGDASLESLVRRALADASCSTRDIASIRRSGSGADPR